MGNPQLKVAVIGGGSSYTPELVEGFILRHRELPVTDLYLVDIEAGKEKLEIVGALAKRMIERAGVPIRVHLTLDRQEAIRGAKFVLTQIRVGMLKARAQDERIPLKYGCIGQETTGAGGFAKGLRTIPVLLDICKDIERLAPDTFLINFTNPAGMVTEAILKHTRVKAIGLCNLPIHTSKQIAKLLQVEPERVRIEMTGINHLNWTQKVWVDGEDRTRQTVSLYENADGLAVSNIPDYKWGEGFLESLQMIPCSYLRYYYLKDRMLEEQLAGLKSGKTRADVVQRVEAELFEIYRNPDLASKPKQLEQRGGAYYSEAAVNLIASIYTNKQDIQIVNVQNNGTIRFLPDDAVIETPCVVTSEGAFPVQLSAQLPAAARGLLQVVKAYEELTVQAGVTGDMHSALQALTIHPLVGSSIIAKRMLEDILAAHREYLPQFR